MTTRRTLLALAALTAAGCTRPPEPAPEPQPASAEPTSAEPSEFGSVQTKPDEYETSDPAAPGGPVPEDASPEDEAAAIDAASLTMGVWVQGSTLEEREWRDKLNATLTPSGQDSTSTVWGYRIRDTEITGAPEILRANAGSAVMRVTTDYTSYEVTVVKTTTGQWLTSHLTTEATEGAQT